MRYRWVRRPSLAILREISGLYRAAGWWDEADTPAKIRRMIQGSHCFLVARADGKAVGMGRALGDRASDAYLQDVFVLPEHRGRGVGAALVERLKRRLLTDGIHWIGLIATGTAPALYRRLGFASMERHTPMLLLRP